MFDYRFYQDLDLGDIYRKVQAGRRLDLEDGLKLFSCQDIVAIGAMAHKVRTHLHGDVAYYVMNQHINYSNICVNGCRFCAFGKQQGDPLAFELSLQAILEKVRARGNAPLTEVHIVGGCHPELRLSFFEGLLRELKAQHPSIIIKAFTAVEIDHFARNEDISTRDVLVRLKAAGLDMLPGGGAEIFSPRVRALLCPEKTAGEDWLKIACEAHQLGIRTNATMLYGHIETIEERLEHLVALRELQDETGGFLCFIPLPFQTANSGLTGIEPTTGIEDLKTMAVSRLMLDNVPHVKAYWIMLTVKLAQLALLFGADDFDGTVIEEKIGRMAGAESGQALTRSDLERIIREGGFEPVERNSFFERVHES
jgi:aminodeoxyfutalosine synthase